MKADPDFQGVKKTSTQNEWAYNFRFIRPQTSPVDVYKLLLSGCLHLRYRGYHQACGFQVPKSISGIFSRLHLPLIFSNARCEGNKVILHPLQCGPAFWPLFDNG